MPVVVSLSLDRIGESPILIGEQPAEEGGLIDAEEVEADLALILAVDSCCCCCCCCF